jgi:hypothetical protein
MHDPGGDETGWHPSLIRVLSLSGLTGFWLAMLNLPLSTAMLSGGGLLTMLLLMTARLQGVAGRARSGAALTSPRTA